MNLENAGQTVENTGNIGENAEKVEENANNAGENAQNAEIGDWPIPNDLFNEIENLKNGFVDEFQILKVTT